MNKNLIGRTASGYEIYIGDDTYRHLAAHSDVQINHITEAISLMDYQPPFIITEVDLCRTIGTDKCVEINAANAASVVKKVRKGRTGTTPVIIDGTVEPEPTTKIVVGICTDRDDGKNTIFTAFYGRLAPKEPWDTRLKHEEQEESRNFWDTHAIICTKEELENA